MINVVIADDHHLVRQGIRSLLEKADDIVVVGEAANGRTALALVERLRPDVLVIDISMPQMDGIQATEQVCALKRVDTQVVILSMHSDKTLVHRALRSGAKGYLLKRSVAEELLLAIRAASQREIYLSPGVSQSVVDDMLEVETEVPSLFNQLTPREREVLQLIAEGQTNRAIADTLSISVKTVEKHRANLMTKMDVNDLASLLRIAIKEELIFLDE